ncbi:hypothetical protein ACXZ1K_05920 [Pedobacter sp. PWIIR3]
MKTTTFLLIILSVFNACTQGSKHPQADLINKSTGEGLSPQQIILYADSIDASLNAMEKSVSLIYIAGESSFHVERYSFQGMPTMLVKYTGNEGISGNSEKYYFKDDSLILIKKNSKLMKDRNIVFTNDRIYLRKNIPFLEDQKTASSAEKLLPIPFKEIKTDQLNAINFQDSVQFLNDAIAGRNRFEMVFDQFIPGSDAASLLLKSKIPGGYTASLNVIQKDAFIDSLQQDPSLFRNQKLNLKWNIVNNEAVYVPVKVTSASGLNK